jgi:signal transduction histidine kinase/DNA-binding LacI/PurR family transcriptional regulator
MLMPSVVDLHAHQWLGAVEAARACGCDLICFSGGELEAPDVKGQANVIYHLVTAETLDALVVWTGALATRIGQDGLEKFFRDVAPLPLVAVEQPLFDAPVVRMENRRGMCTAVSHLIEVHGCRRIAFVRGPASVDASLERYQGFLDALEQHGLVIHPELVSPHLRSWIPEIAAAWVSDMLGAGGAPDAIVASNDDQATGVVFALETAGHEEIAVVGYDDSPNFRTNDVRFTSGGDDDASLRREVAISASAVSLTTVRAPFQEMGRCAVEVALALVRGETVPAEARQLPTELVIRRSCGCLPTLSPAEPVVSAGARELPARLRQALAYPAVEDLPADWAEQLTTAFLREMHGESDDAFPRLLDHLVRLSLRSGANARDWSRALFTLRQVIDSAADTAETARAEDAWQRAHLLVTDTSERQHWRYMRALVENRNQILQEVGQQLSTAADVAGLVRILPSQLARVGVPGCYLSVYEPDVSDPNGRTPVRPIASMGNAAIARSRLLLAYRNGRQSPIDPDSAVFPSVHLVPGARLRRPAPLSMVAIPLYFKDQQLGFVLFELGPKIGWVYATLGEQLSSALHRLFMAERERAAVAALEEIHRQDERQRLASDLHDSVSQALFSMTLQTRALELTVQRRGGDADGLVGQGLAELRALIQAALAEMRALIFQLRPDALHDDGLVVAVRKHAAAVAARAGYDVRVQAPVDRLPLEERVETELFRVVQEALHNSVKHAQPSHIEIRLREAADADGTLVVEVADDGIGFDPTERHPGHLGLETMRERTERLGGRLTIDSSRNGSTTIRVMVPYRRSAQVD